ncbi:hypothetical protein [Porphyromonas gulae]|uniref:hypothetical protein n=1 Tax=Porphyromonas gulae TaxID=111105 RepID=UPI0018AFCA17|nr:hypothetical protein [Porphyromonas gulae]
MAMGRYARISKCTLRTLITLLWAYSLSSCNLFNLVSYKKVSCDFDYSIRDEEKSLDLTKYQLEKIYENDSCSVIVLTMGEGEHTKYMYMRKSGIRKIMRYSSTNNIRYAFFQYSEADIGPRYYFDEYGNIKDSINTDVGYTICWAQAWAIGKSYAKHKMHKTEPKLILTKEDEEIIRWYFFYTNKKEERQRITIDGQTGQILEERRVVVICSN